MTTIEQTPAAAAPTATDTRAAWRQRLIDLDLDPDLDAMNRGIIKHTRSIAELKRWYAIPPNPDAPVNDVPAEKIATIPDGLVRRYISQHIYEQRVIRNPDTIRELEKRAGRMFLLVQAAADITITAASPLNINSTGVLTVYDNVTIQDGGYIAITAACTFQCNTLTKVQSGGSGPAFDVSISGLNGANATPGLAATPNPPPQATGGSGSTCTCCGGNERSSATAGATGTKGPDGGNAIANAMPGDNGPIVFFSVAEQLTGTLSFSNQGGNGGNGGAGANGAVGGQGGDGGNGGYCGAVHCNGATGGTGGQGGSGGNGSNGANGGNGGTLTISVPASAPAGSVLVTNGAAPGGLAGAAGQLGAGGLGGAAGTEGGNAGGNGAAGASDGEPGTAGTPGNPGTATLNGSPIG